MTKYSLKIFWFLIILYFSVNPNHQVFSSDRIISERVKKMQMADDVMRVIKKNILNSDFQAMTKNAQLILDWADEMITYFPRDSGASASNSSAASYEIWENSISFKFHIESKKENLNSLLIAAKNKDIKLVRKSFKATEEICKSCHEQFRN